jgi:tetratricopeptide (TPR) repeat protein
MDPASAITSLKKAEEAAKFIDRLVLRFQKQRYPKPRRNATGVLIAIATENDANRKQVQNDFIRKLEELLTSSSAQKPFQVIELPWYHVDKIKTIEDAKKVILKCRAKFMLWGIVRTRNFDGKPYLVFDVRSIVSHGEIVETATNALADEMAQLLPRRVLISKQDDLVELEFNATNIDLAGRYIIAETLYLSGDREFALQLFEELGDQLSRIQTAVLPDTLRHHVGLLIAKVTQCRLVIHLNDGNDSLMTWRRTRRAEDLEDAVGHIKKADALMLGTYGSALIWSIYYFIQGDIPGARKILQPWNSASSQDATWALNQAFLYLYEGKLREAKRFYEIAFRRDIGSSTVLEVEEFMEWMLSEHPDKVQINYGLGMINYCIKEEPGIAKEYFERFVQGVSSGQYREQVDQVRKHIENISANKPYRMPRKLA